MKKFTHIILIGMMTALMMSVTSCLDEHIEPVDLTLKVGNVYCHNGSVYPVNHCTQQTDLQPVGVVVAVGGENDSWQALVMGLHDIGKACYLDDTASEIKGISTDTDAFDGKQNTSALIQAMADDKSVRPEAALMVAAYTEGGTSGWHLPSVAELRMAAVNRWAIHNAINAVGGEPFSDDWYQTSTTDGSSSETEMLYNYCVILPEGRVVSENKTVEHRVRPFLILR